MEQKRLKKLQSYLNYPLLIKKKENLLYLTGRFFMSGYLLVKKNEVVFFGDGLEKPPGVRQVDRLKYIGKYLHRHRILQLEDQFTFAEYNYIKLKVKNEKLKIKLRHVRSPVDFQRMIKDESEIRLIRKSMQIVGKVFLQIKKQLAKKSWTEIGLAKFITLEGHRLGADEISFPPIVASGRNAAIPHHHPSNKKLEAGESVIIDFGFKYQGYCSDFTRTVFLKRVPAKLEKIYNQAEAVYLKTINQAKVDVKAKHLYQIAINTLNKHHLGKYFIHNLGHGAGLEIHELPNLSPESKDVLKEGMVFSIEPGVYIPNLGGIRIEDLVCLKQVGVERFINISTSLVENVI